MKGLKTVVAAMFAATLLVGCSEDQTAFNVEEIPGRCTIKGEIVYNLGTTYEDGKFVYNYQPVANTPVYVTVANNKYSDGLAGNSTFETVTDENGNYTIDIPAANDKMTVTVTTPDFELEKTVVTVENNQVVTKTENTVYRADATISDVHANGIVLQNILCTECNSENYYEGYTQYATLKGLIGMNSEYYVAPKAVKNNLGVITRYESATCKSCWVPTGKVDMIVTINYDGHKETLNATTSNSGEFSLQVPVKGFPADFSYSIKVMPFASKFTHYEAVTKTFVSSTGSQQNYTDYVPYTLDGYYAQDKNNGSSYSANYPVSGEVVSEKSKLMVFSAYNNGQELHGYSTSNISTYNEWLSDILNDNTTK